MTVSATTPVTSSTTSTAQAATDAASASLDYNSFLKLLLQQMKSQDPTNPVDQTQMLAQLAQFSAVGQTIQTNTKLAQLITNSEAQTGSALIGRNVTDLVGGSTGVVKSIAITSTGTTANLDNGTSFDISGGIRING